MDDSLGKTIVFSGLVVGMVFSLLLLSFAIASVFTHDASITLRFNDYRELPLDIIAFGLGAIVSLVGLRTLLKHRSIEK